MAVDLKSMSTKELEKLHSEVEKALESARSKDKKEALKAAKKAAAEFGMTLAELTEEEAGESKPKKRRAKAKAPKNSAKPKYANPDDPKKTWTGKGRQPNWYREAVEKGVEPATMEI